MDALLRVVGGPFCGQSIQVPHGKLLIGRAEDCGLRPNSEFVSGHHCVLLLDDYTLRIRDLGSKNGTSVNGRRIGTGVTILLHDDMVSIGEMSIVIDLNHARTVTEAPDSETPSPASLAALQGTGVFDGDTLQAEIQALNPPPIAPPPASPPAPPPPHAVAAPVIPHVAHPPAPPNELSQE